MHEHELIEDLRRNGVMVELRPTGSGVMAIGTRESTGERYTAQADGSALAVAYLVGRVHLGISDRGAGDRLAA